MRPQAALMGVKLSKYKIKLLRASRLIQITSESTPAALNHCTIGGYMGDNPRVDPRGIKHPENINQWIGQTTSVGALVMDYAKQNW